MNRVHLFADEAGNFDFTRKQGASRYFMLATIATQDCSPGDALLRLRRELAWRGVEQQTQDLHATEELQVVRDELFRALAGEDFRIDVSVWDKPKVYPYLASDPERFYKTAWYIHLKHVAPQVCGAGDEMMVLAASIGTKNRAKAVRSAIDDVAAQCSLGDHRTELWKAASDPCFWVADFCCWAVQRKWELRDLRSHVLIQSKILSEFEVTGASTRTYY